MCSCFAQGLKEYSKELAVGLLSAMYEDDADFTNTFRALGGVASQPSDRDDDGVPAPLMKVCRIVCSASCGGVHVICALSAADAASSGVSEWHI